MARRGRKLKVEWAAEYDAASLRARYRRERRADVRPLLHGLWLVRTGHTTCETAELLGVDERTVQRWLAWYRAGGLTPLEQHHAGSQGAPSVLRPEQKAELSEGVATGRFRTAAEIRQWVEERWGSATPRAGCPRCWGGCGAPRRCPAPSTSRPTTSRTRGGKRAPLCRCVIGAVSRRAGRMGQVGSGSASLFGAPRLD
jgi:transposase